MALPDKGQRDARAMFDAAKAGTFSMPEDSARRLADHCDRLADGLDDEIDASDELTRVSGFPDLPSGHQLADGFSAKGFEYQDALAAYLETALRYKAAYLAAGSLFEEADAANTAALKRATAYLENHQ